MRLTVINLTAAARRAASDDRGDLTLDAERKVVSGSGSRSAGGESNISEGDGMGLLSKLTGAGARAPQTPFWQQPPIRGSDPVALYAHGVRSVTQQDGPAMMATGWALWTITGIHQHQAFDFLSDGYGAWRSTAAFDPALGRMFTEQLLAGLEADPPVPTDIYSAAPDVVEPLATHYSARCWAASELASYEDVSAEDKQRIYSAIERAPQPFVPPRSMHWARAYAHNQGLPVPWS